MEMLSHWQHLIRILAVLGVFSGSPVPFFLWAGEDWTLERALAHVGENAPDARMAALRFEKARAQLDEARAQWLPKLNAETGYAATDNPTQAFMFLLNQRQLTFGGDFNDPDVTDNWGSELRLEYPLYAGGARQAGVAAADAGVAASEYELAAARRQLELEVARGYFQVLRARENIQAADAAVLSQKSNLELARARFEAGSGLQTAVLDLETELNRAEADLVAAENQRDLATSMLKTLLGLDADRSFSVAGGWKVLDDPGEVIGSTRPEELALEKRAAQADAGLEAARADRKPKVAAFASTRHDEGFTESDGGNSWIAGVMVRLNLFNGGETSARVAQAEVDREIVGEQLRKQKQQIELQVTSAQLNLQTARKRRTLAENAIKSAGESLDQTRKRFEEGVALSSQLIDSETALTGARVRLAGARAEEQIAIASLRHALGLPIQDVKNLSK